MLNAETYMLRLESISIENTFKNVFLYCMFVLSNQSLQTLKLGMWLILKAPNFTICIRIPLLLQSVVIWTE